MISTTIKAFNQFSSDQCLTLAASLAYYTLFAMPPLLFLLVTVVSLGMSAAYDQQQADARARAFLEQQAGQLIGNDAAADEIGRIIHSAERRRGNWWKSLLSIAGILVGATGLVEALQSALNRVWRVAPKQGKFAVQFLVKRMISLTMILAFGFLLLVSFVVATILTALTNYASDQFGLLGVWPTVINQTVSLLTAWAFFSFVFRFMPDAHVPWMHALAGGLFTVVLFSLGRVALLYYLSTTSPAAKLGSAAASLAVILLWVYYSSIILLFGAEFTANLREYPSQPEEGADRVAPHVPT
jgi:membrane protein